MAEESDESGERTEEATPQRREEFRNQGQVAMTRELSSALVLFGSAIVVWLLGKFFLEQISLLYKELFGGMLVNIAKDGDFIPAIKFAVTKASFILAPLFLLY